LQFPRDFGSHPDLQTEWWYITGQLQAGGKPWGFQLTFFRSRIEAAQGLQSALAAKQLIFAHAALCDVEGQAATTSAWRARDWAWPEPAKTIPMCISTTGISSVAPYQDKRQRSQPLPRPAEARTSHWILNLTARSPCCCRA
jgi:hypothetical protein